MNKIEYRGDFFLPENEDRKLTGKLSIEENGKVYLELFGFLDPDLSHYSTTNEFAIWGVLFNDQTVSLLKAFRIKSQSFLNSKGFERFSINNMVLGDFIYSENEKVFSHVTAEFTYLNTWYSFKNDKLSFSKSKLDNHSVINYEYQPIEPLDIQINNKIRLEIYEGYSYPFSTFSGFHFSKRLYFSLHFEECKSLKELKEYIFSLKRLFTILLGKSIELSYLSFRKNFEIESKGQNTEENIFYGNINFESIDSNQKYNFLFDYENIEECFKKIIERWFDLDGTIFSYMTMILTSWVKAKTFSYSKFLQSYQVAEGLNKLLNNSKMDINKIKPQKNNIIFERILDQIKLDKDKEWLSEMISFKLQKSQSQLIKDSILKLISSSMFGDQVSNIDSVMKKLKKLRGSITHLNENNKNEIDLRLLSLYTDLLNISNICTLFEILGIDNNLFHKRIKKFYSYKIDNLKTDLFLE